MKNKNQTSQTWTFYLLKKQDVVFVGMTSAQKIAPVFYTHTRGENRYTQNYFSRCEANRPNLHILEKREVDKEQAYKVLVAWTNIFIRSGYYVLGNPTVIHHARNLHIDTSALVEKIMRKPLTEILKDTYLEKFTDAVAKPTEEESKPSREKADTKITIRLSQSERQQFDAFVHNMHLSQRDALMFLLDEYGNTDTPSAIQNSDRYIGQKMDSLKKRINELTQALEDSRAKSSHLQRSFTARINNLKTDIGEFFQLFASSNKIPLHVEEARYKDYMKSLRGRVEYPYPAAEGSALVLLQAVLMGKGARPAHFVLVTDPAGNHFKLRFYNKPTFIGIPPWNDTYALRHSCWLIRWEESSDGAMDINFAIPVQLQQKYDNPGDLFEIDRRNQEALRSASED